MKNHLSMELSIFSGGRSWLGGRAGSWSEGMRLGECETAVLALVELVVLYNITKIADEFLHRDALGVGLASDQALPGLGALTDDVHGVASRIVSLSNGKMLDSNSANLLFLHSPVKANWFSGLPSGIL
jgi:hypothetical protein